MTDSIRLRVYETFKRDITITLDYSQEAIVKGNRAAHIGDIYYNVSVFAKGIPGYNGLGSCYVRAANLSLLLTGKKLTN